MVLSGGCSGALALMAAGAGAESVTCIERSPLAYRMTLQLLSGNTHLHGHSKIKVVTVVTVEGFSFRTNEKVLWYNGSMLVLRVGRGSM